MIRFGLLICCSLAWCMPACFTGQFAAAQSAPKATTPARTASATQAPSQTQTPSQQTPSQQTPRTEATLARATSSSTAPAQPPADLNVNDLTAMLRMIDPYRPDGQVKAAVKVYGSTAMDAMAHMWADQLKQFHPQLTVEIAAAGSGDAFDKLRSQPTSIAMLSRPVTAAELQQLKSATIKNPAAFVVAREALGVYVHATNPATSISGEQLREIFTTQSGEQEPKWKLLGVTGPMSEKPIHLVARSETSGTQAYLRDFIFGGMQMRAGVGSHASNADTLGALAKDPLAITICGLRVNGSSVRVLPLVASGGVISSDDAAIMSGRYPLTRSMTLVIDLDQAGPEAEAAREFVHFAICQVGQLDAIRAGFFPAELAVLRAGLDRLQRDHTH